MARTLALQKNGEDPVGAPDFTLPVSIIAQVIPKLDVNIAAQSIPTLNINISSISQGVTVTTTVSNMPSTFPLPDSQISTLQQVTIANIAAGLVFNVNVSQITAAININNWPSTYPLPSSQVTSLQQITIQNVAAGLVFNVNISQVTAALNIANFPSEYPLPSAQVSSLQQITIQNVAAGLNIPVNIAQITAAININNWPSSYPLPSSQVSTLQQITIQNVAAGLYIPIDIKQVSTALNISNFPSSYPLPDAQVSTLQQVTIANIAAGLYIPINIAQVSTTISTQDTIVGIAAGVYIPITIHNVESGVIFNINISSISSGVTFNVNITGSTTLNVNISGITSGVVFNVAQSGAWTVNVSNTSFDVYVTNSSLTVTVSGTVNVNVTNSSLTVTISGTPTINVQTSSGTNIIIDKLTQGAYTERQSTLANNGDTGNYLAPGTTYRRGKFFPRGCRGFLQRVEIYCDNLDTSAHTLYVYVSPMPGMAPIFSGSISLAASSSSAWRSLIINRFWNYDSMFIYVLGDSGSYPRVVYDTGSPADYYYSSDEAIWYFTAYRFWFRAVLSGETVGDLPVSGTLNTIEIPAISSRTTSGSVSVPSGTEQTVLTVSGLGECDCLKLAVFAASYSDYTSFRVYCDGVEVFHNSPRDLSLDGHTASTPAISLLKYSSGGDCVILLTKRFMFRRSLIVKAYATGAQQTVGAEVFVNLIG
jgi:hypothetical protein